MKEKEPSAQPATVVPQASEQWRVVGQLESSVDALQTEAARLDREIHGLRDKLDKPKPRLERLSGVLALLAVFFSLVKFPADFVAAYITRTNTSLSPDRQAALQYDNKDQILEVRWKIDIQNDGSKQDYVRIAEAALVVPVTAATPNVLIAFETTASGFRNVNAVNVATLIGRIFIDAKQPGSYVCVLRRRASVAEIQHLTQAPSRRCLRMRLEGRDSTYQLPDACFDLLSSDVRPIVAGEEFAVTFDSSGRSL